MTSRYEPGPEERPRFDDFLLVKYRSGAEYDEIRAENSQLRQSLSEAQAEIERLKSGALVAYENALDAIQNNTEEQAIHLIECAIAGLKGLPVPAPPGGEK